MVHALPKNGGDDIVGLAGLAHVGRALLQNLGPEFLVGEPMRADDGKPGEFTVQTLHFAPAEVSRSSTSTSARCRAIVGRISSRLRAM